MKPTTSSILFGIFVSALVACGGAQPAPESPAAPSPAESGAEAPAEASPTRRFADLSEDEKVEVMITKVVPNVGKVFKEHDPTRYEQFNCASCHGPQKNQDPREVLPKLTLSNGGMEKLSSEQPDVMKFMAEKVVPEMAAAIGEQPYDPATQQGFGCGGCHTVL